MIGFTIKWYFLNNIVETYYLAEVKLLRFPAYSTLIHNRASGIINENSVMNSDLIINLSNL